MGLEAELVLVILEIRIQTDLLSWSMEKCYGSCKSKSLSTLLMIDEEVVARIQFPNDIPPKSLDILVE